MQRYIERSWPLVEIRSSQITWPCIEASRLGRRRSNMHAQTVCVAKQAWILHELCSVGEDKLCSNPSEATMVVENVPGA